VHLHSDDFWHFIKNGAIAPYLPEAHQQNKVVIDVLAKVADRYARGGYFVVLDGIIGPWFLQPFKELTLPLHYIVLSLPVSIAIQRCRNRAADTLTDPKAIRELHQQFSSLGELEHHNLRTDRHHPQETLDEVIRALQGGAFRLFSP